MPVIDGHTQVLALDQGGNTLYVWPDPESISGGTAVTHDAATYTIYIDSLDANKIKARSGATGNIDYSGTDAATVINAAIAACTSGGLILVAPGTYTLYKPIICDLDNITLRGSGPNSGVTFAISSSTGNLFTAASTTTIVTGGVTGLVTGSSAAIIFGNTRNVLYCQIENIELIGNCYQNLGNLAGKPFDGIWMRGSDCNVSNCRVKQFPNDGIRVDSFDFNVTTIYDAILYNNYCHQNVNNQYFIGILVSDFEAIECRADGGNNIGIAGAASSQHCFRVMGGAGKFISCHAYFAPGYGLYADRGGQFDVISGSWENNSTGGIRVHNFSSGTMQRVRILDGWFYGNGVQDIWMHGLDYSEVRRVRSTSGTGGIKLESMTYSTVADCTTQFSGTGLSVDAASSHVMVEGNRILSGALSFLASSGSVRGNTIAGVLTIGAGAVGVDVTGNTAASLADSGTGTIYGTNVIGGSSPFSVDASGNLSLSGTLPASHLVGMVPAVALPVDGSIILVSGGVLTGNYQAGTGVSITGNVISATGSGGTVTSVGLSMPGEFSVASTPVTGSGTLAVSKVVQGANSIFAGPPSGSASAPLFRSLTEADLPNPTAAQSLIAAAMRFS